MTKGVTFYFVRHGETYLNRLGRFQGWADAPLTPEGLEIVHQSGRGLADVKFDAVRYLLTFIFIACQKETRAV